MHAPRWILLALIGLAMSAGAAPAATLEQTLGLDRTVAHASDPNAPGIPVAEVVPGERMLIDQLAGFAAVVGERPIPIEHQITAGERVLSPAVAHGADARGVLLHDRRPVRWIVWNGCRS